MEQAFSRTLRLTTVWLLICGSVFAVAQWRLRPAVLPQAMVLDGRTVELHRGADGQYHWPGRVNGRRVDFLIDTGASGTAISTALARQLHLTPLGSLHSRTAGGVVSGQLVAADIVLQGGVSIRKLRVAALPDLGNRPLLGMDVLGGLRLAQQGGVLRIDVAGSR